MGMHFGIIAGRLSLDVLLQAFGELGLELRQMKALDRMEDAPRDRNATYVIAGEREGASYLLDESMLVSAGQADLLAAGANRTGALLVGCGAETVSGTFWFTAFNGPDLLRMFWMCRSELGAPFNDGQPLQSETRYPLDMDWDGDGIFAALGELGFDYKAWLAAGPYRLLTLEDVPELAHQPLEDALKEHCRKHPLGPGERPKITVVQRPPANNPSSRSLPELGGGGSLPSDRRSVWQRVIQSFRPK